MNKLKKILVVEDDITSGILIKRILLKAGYSVVVVHKGVDALRHLEFEEYNAVLTDWMMPNMDGIELIRNIRSSIRPIPLIIMITALVSDEARYYALESGADDYIAKPFDSEEVLACLEQNLIKYYDKRAKEIDLVEFDATKSIPTFVGVFFAASTGGPVILQDIFKSISPKLNAAYYIVQHGPPWIIDTLANKFQKYTQLKVSVARHNDVSKPGNIYFAAGNKHLRVEPGSFLLNLDEGPKENFTRPSADPLFRSGAEAFGKYAIAVVLTGMGRDGTQGAVQIASVNGRVIVQDPETATASSMPKSVLESNINCIVVHPEQLSRVLVENIIELNSELQQNI